MRGSRLCAAVLPLLVVAVACAKTPKEGQSGAGQTTTIVPAVQPVSPPDVTETDDLDGSASTVTTGTPAGPETAPTGGTDPGVSTQGQEDAAPAAPTAGADSAAEDHGAHTTTPATTPPAAPAPSTTTP